MDLNGKCRLIQSNWSVMSAALKRRRFCRNYFYGMAAASQGLNYGCPLRSRYLLLSIADNSVAVLSFVIYLG